MTFLLCKLWPYLAGGLIGWLLAGWFARRLKYASAPVEQDNSKHLALIGKLENENKKIPNLVSRIAKFEAASPKVAEKIIDNPDHLARIKVLESENSELADLRARLKSLEGQGTDVVEKEVEKVVDNPAHIKKISDLEAQLTDLKRGPAIDIKAAKAAGLKIKSETDFTVIEGIGPKINDLIHADGITTLRELADAEPARIQKILDVAGPSYTIANPGTWPDQASLAVNNRWDALKSLQDILDGGVYPNGSAKAKAGSSADSALKSASVKSKPAKKKAAKKAPPKLDIDGAKAFGFKIKQNNGQDDFTLIEGIGPKINELIHSGGIHTFYELSNTHVDIIQKILDNAGSSFRLAKPGTWPAQADMAASNSWETLKAWQDELDGGEES